VRAGGLGGGPARSEPVKIGDKQRLPLHIALPRNDPRSRRQSRFPLRFATAISQFLGREAPPSSRPGLAPRPGRARPAQTRRNSVFRAMIWEQCPEPRTPWGRQSRAARRLGLLIRFLTSAEHRAACSGPEPADGAQRGSTRGSTDPGELHGTDPPRTAVPTLPTGAVKSSPREAIFKKPYNYINIFNLNTDYYFHINWLWNVLEHGSTFCSYLKNTLLLAQNTPKVQQNSAKNQTPTHYFFLRKRSKLQNLNLLKEYYDMVYQVPRCGCRGPSYENAAQRHSSGSRAHLDSP